MIIRRSLTPLNSSRTLRAVRQRETVRGSDDNSRRKVQNVRTHSWARPHEGAETVCSGSFTGIVKTFEVCSYDDALYSS